MPGFDSPARSFETVLPSSWSVRRADVGVACFVEGTRVETVRGLRMVERLGIGDKVVTLPAGSSSVVRPVAVREVDCRRHPAPERVWPVRVAAHAFGPCEPMRTLLVSPGLGVWVDGRMVPVGALVNGRTILQVRMDRVRYYHVALERLAAVLAEGLAVESHSEPVGKGRVVPLFPDFRARGDGGEVGDVWQRLAERAEMLSGKIGLA